MMCAKNLFRKAYLLRKKNWSAPTIMTVFILACMLLVYSFEAIGILHKERNIDYRIVNPETYIKTVDVSKDKISVENVIKREMSIADIQQKLKTISIKNKEDNIEKIKQIMIEGALNQINFENSSNADEKEYVNEIEEEQFEFFDF